jgi:acetylglutamate kinase
MQHVSIIKIGGNIIDDKEATARFLLNFSQVPGYKLLIHGGGKIATQIAERLGLKAQMVDGRRITDQSMLEVVTMVYGGLVNKQIVAGLQAKGCNAIGLTGADGNCVLAKKREVATIDYGFAGDIVAVNAQQISSFLEQRLTPVFAPLTYDTTGSMLNTNADTMAATIAWSLASRYNVHLIYCFEKKGVLSDPENDDSVIPTLSLPMYEQLKQEGIISKGMIPKLDNAYTALRKGLQRVIICHADELATVVSTSTVSGTTLSL